MVRVHHEDPEHRAHLPALADPRVRRQCFQRMAATRLPAQDRSDRGGLGVNVPLIVAGSLAILGAAIHGVGGEVLVVRKLSPGMLPSSPFGGPRMTKSMIHVTWHMTTIAFLTVGSALLLSGSVLHGDTARGSACSPPAPPPASPRSRWGWGLPTRNRNPLDPCSSTPVPPCSSSPRRWRGGELSDCGGPGVARSKPWEVSDELWAVVEPLLPKVERLSSAPSPLAAPG